MIENTSLFAKQVNKVFIENFTENFLAEFVNVDYTKDKHTFSFIKSDAKFIASTLYNLLYFIQNLMNNISDYGYLETYLEFDNTSEIVHIFDIMGQKCKYKEQIEQLYNNNIICTGLVLVIPGALEVNNTMSIMMQDIIKCRVNNLKEIADKLKNDMLQNAGKSLYINKCDAKFIEDCNGSTKNCFKYIMQFAQILTQGDGFVHTDIIYEYLPYHNIEPVKLITSNGTISETLQNDMMKYDKLSYKIDHFIFNLY